MSDTPKPIGIKLHQTSRLLELEFDDDSKYELPCEYLRVYSPSAEVRGHGPGQETLQVGKENVNIQHIEPVGNYAIKLQFSDGHDTGIYSWDLLYELAHDYGANWQSYLDRLSKAGYQRRESAQT